MVDSILYSINDLEKISGIKAHTIRIWEKRYHILEPKRTTSNIRLYTENDLQKLMNIVFLKNKGFKISEISKMTISQISNAIVSHSDFNFTSKEIIDTMTLSLLNFDTIKLKCLVNTIIDKKGLHIAIAEYINPFMDKMSFLYSTKNISSVHFKYLKKFMSNIFRIKIEELPLTNLKNEKIVFYLNEADNSQLSHLWLIYIAKKLGFQSINIGDNINIDELKEALHVIKPKIVVTFLNKLPKDESTSAYLKNVCSTLGENAKLIVTGKEVIRFSSPELKNLIIFKRIKDFENILSRV